jgi:elongation factor Ts
MIMAEITAGMVKSLRESTGVGMMDCKAALAATNGDMEAATDWLRAKGLAKAAKKSTRVAAEGLVGIAVNGTTGAAVEVNSETDFVARNEKFQAMVADIAKLALAADGNTEKLKTAKFPGSSHPVAEYVAEMVATIGENMGVRRTASLKVKDGVIGSYVHNQAAPGLGKIGVLVALESTGNKEELAAFGRLLSMHVAATNPVAMDLAGVPPETLAREKAILEEKNAGWSRLMSMTAPSR